MTQSKSAKLIQACQNIMGEKSISIREVASVVGMMVPSFPGVRHEPLYYCS